MKGFLFSGLPVSDYPRAVDWYGRLLGGPATFQPHDTECVWDLAERQSVYVVLRPDRAGGGLATWFFEEYADLDRFVDAAVGHGIEPTEQETYDNGVRKVTFHDPDGNELGVAGNPAGA